MDQDEETLKKKEIFKLFFLCETWRKEAKKVGKCARLESYYKSFFLAWAGW